MAKKIIVKKGKKKHWVIGALSKSFGAMLKDGKAHAMQQLMKNYGGSINKICQDVKREECIAGFEKGTDVSIISRNTKVSLESVRRYKNEWEAKMIDGY